MSEIFCPVIPVLDIMIGRVVWAKGGQRHQYRPVDSKLTHDSDPVGVAKAIYNQTGCQWLYLADIDSFAGANPNWAVYQSLIEAGFKLMIDANWMAPGRIDNAISTFARCDSVKLIVSSETLESVQQFDLFKRIVDADIDVCFSIDMQGDHVIAQSSQVAELSPLQLLKQAYRQGVRNFILLDLETVGTGSGIETNHSIFNRKSFLSEIANEFEDIRLISGGGIRNHEDCQTFLTAGCRNVLVASAIFDCCITPDEIAMLEPFRYPPKNCEAVAEKV